MNAPAPIGVFDSGHGGLTVLAALGRQLPGEHFLYLGDHAAAPYGERSPAEIYARTQAAVELLFALGCRLVLLACNTATAVALRRLQQGWLARNHPERRVLGVVAPMVETLSGRAWTGGQPLPDQPAAARSVAVFATRRTVESGAFPREVQLRAPQVAIDQQACPGLVDAIEQDRGEAALVAVIGQAVAALLARHDDRPPEAAVLGCTHYPLVAAHFAAALPPGVRLLSQPELVGRALERYLQRYPALSSGAGETRYYTTGEPAFVSGLAGRFLGRPAGFARVP
ncbi:MAG: glutamate racemase [Rhodospirillales bacterium]